MDLATLTFEQFCSSLGSYSPKKLKELARSHNIPLPLGLEAKDALLRCIYDALKGSGPTSPVEPGAPSSPPPGDVGAQIKVVSTTGRAYWRCGHQWKITWQTVPAGKFTLAELDVLRKDKNLRVKDVAPEA